MGDMDVKRRDVHSFNLFFNIYIYLRIYFTAKTFKISKLMSGLAV